MHRLILVSFCVLALVPANTHAGERYSSEDIDKQSQELEQRQKACGPLALWYCLRQLHYPVPDCSDYLRQIPLDRRGTDLHTLLEVGKAQGVPVRAIHLETKAWTQLPIPSILIIDDQHCLLYEGPAAKAGHLLILDPADSLLDDWPEEHIQRHWTGQALVFTEPAPTAGDFLGRVIWSFLLTSGVVAALLLGWHLRAWCLKSSRGLQR